MVRARICIPYFRHRILNATMDDDHSTTMAVAVDGMSAMMDSNLLVFARLFHSPKLLHIYSPRFVVYRLMTVNSHYPIQIEFAVYWWQWSFY